MHLNWIALAGFRSYTQIEWHPEPGVNLLVGDNGAGKTNLLEAIGFLATLRSFRGSPDEALVAHGSDSGVVRGQVAARDTVSLIEIELRRNRPRRAQVNGQRLGRTADLLGHARVVWFLPDDLDIVKRGPAHRREFLDSVAVQLMPASHLDQAEYDRALRQRNAFLRQGSDDETTLGVWDERLAQAGGKVMARRARAAAALRPALSDAHTRISGSDTEIALHYGATWGVELDETIPAPAYAAALSAALAGARRADRERRITTVGPHRDDPAFVLDGHDLRHHGSQGEQRTTALSLRLAAHLAITEQTGGPPLLLLDDVFSELDPIRAGSLAETLAVELAGTQAIVTTADRGDVPVEGTVWRVREGGVGKAGAGGVGEAREGRVP